MSLCLHEVDGEPYPDRVGGVLAMSGGIPMTTLSPEPSLIITRALNAEMGTQTLIPSRFMAGLLPDCLIDKVSTYYEMRLTCYCTIQLRQCVFFKDV